MSKVYFFCFFVFCLAVGVMVWSDQYNTARLPASEKVEIDRAIHYMAPKY